MDKLKWLLKVSRPRFWAYLIGPYLVGYVAASAAGFALGNASDIFLIAMGVYFTLPANLLIYGINDVYDYETDKLNPKKGTYEALVTPKHHNSLAAAIAITNFPFILTFLFWNTLPIQARTALALFLFFGIAYSAPPIRAKVRPFIDTMFNSLYVFPALVSYGLITATWPNPRLFFAAVLWCMAMHAYSAVPDIIADKKAKIDTVATVLGSRGTLLFCLGCYIGAVILSYPNLEAFALAAGGVYVSLVVLSLNAGTSKAIFKLYKWFPSINLIVGFGLFWYVHLVKVVVN